MLYLRFIPRLIRSNLLRLAGLLSIPNAKYNAEFYYWYTQRKKHGGRLPNDWYRPLMLMIAGESDQRFVEGKVIADFGCGPCGSLCWADNAKARIGIDVLADKYQFLGIDSHNMTYVKSSEDSIPSDNESIDILFTINAMDHVDNFEFMSQEITRIIKPGGEFIGSFNLEESSTVCEPQTLTEERIKRSLLSHFDIMNYRMAKFGPEGDRYKHFNDGSEPATEGPRYLWVRAKKH